MQRMLRNGIIAIGWFCASSCVLALEPPLPVDKPVYDAAMAERTGADDMGMRQFVLVILKSSDTPVPKGPERDEMFKGHFSNMGRLSKEGVLALAGPLDGVDGWRGLFVLAVKDIETAKKHVETDPVIVKGEMVAEYHKYYGSAALMLIPELHEQLQRPEPPREDSTVEAER